MTSSDFPDRFDRALAILDGLPDTAKTRPTTIRTLPLMGIGGSTLHVVQTVRQSHEDGRSEDTIFVECVDTTGTVRMVLPPRVADAIARQREALSAKSRSRAASRAAADRKARGERPAFLRRRKAEGEA